MTLEKVFFGKKPKGKKPFFSFITPAHMENLLETEHREPDTIDFSIEKKMMAAANKIWKNFYIKEEKRKEALKKQNWQTERTKAEVYNNPSDNEETDEEIQEEIEEWEVLPRKTVKD